MSARRPPALVFILVTMFLDIVGMGIAIPVFPQLVTQVAHCDLSRAASIIGGLSAVYTAVMFLCAPILGALSDRFGRKPVLLGALLATCIHYGLMAAAPGLAWLYVARVFGGLGGASLTVAQTYIADVSAPEERAKNFGLTGAAFGVGFIVGPALGGWLGAIRPSLPFVASGLVTLLNLLYGLWGVPESHRLENRRALDWTEANPFGWIKTLREYPVVLGLVGALLWIWFANQALQNTWVVFTSYRFHWTPADNGLSLALVGILSAISQAWLLRLVLPKLGERRLVLAGLGLNALALLLFGLATQSWMMYAILVGSSLANMVGPALQGLISRQVGPDKQGAVQGALTGVMSLTGIVSPLVANNLFAFCTAPHTPVYLPGVAFFAGAACSLVALWGIWRQFLAMDLPSPPEGGRGILDRRPGGTIG